SSPTSASSYISGQVTTSDGTPLSGVTIALYGSSIGRTITDAQGYYSFGELETGGFYTVTPQLSNYSFGPVTRTISLAGNLTDATFVATQDAIITANPL